MLTGLGMFVVVEVMFHGCVLPFLFLFVMG